MNWETIPVPSGHLFESPVWNARSQEIAWVDIIKGLIFQYHPGTKKLESFAAGQMVGAIAVKRSGGYIAALQKGFAEIDTNANSIQIISDPESHLPGNRFNDGKCDPVGRFWAGTMSMAGTTDGGCLYSLDNDHSVSLKIKGVGCSNGLAWSCDHSTFFYIDTLSQQVAAYDYDLSTGSIGNRRIVITIPAEDGMPDGMTIDADGMLWIAIWGAGRVERWDPYAARRLKTFSLPCSNISSCTFGGDELTDLYITSAREGLSAEQSRLQPYAGSLFVIRSCGYSGLPPFEFNDA